MSRARAVAPAFLALVQGCLVQRAVLGPEQAEVCLGSAEALLAPLVGG